MEMVWKSGNGSNLSRLLYADALIANGRIDIAAQVLHGIPNAEERLLYQSWYRYIENQDFERASYALQTALRINPDNSEAKIRLKNIQEHLENQ